MSWTHPRDYAISLNDALASNDDAVGGVPGRARLGLMSPARRFNSYHSNHDHGPIPPGIAILARCAPFIGKAIVVGLFGLVAGICATYGWSW